METAKKEVLRHVDLFEAIDSNLSCAVGKLEALRNRLEGSVDKGPPELAQPVATPVPAMVYENSPVEIRALAVRISDLVNEIQKMVV